MNFIITYTFTVTIALLVARRIVTKQSIIKWLLNNEEE
jgi:hypothetical protein